MNPTHDNRPGRARKTRACGVLLIAVASITSITGDELAGALRSHANGAGAVLTLSTRATIDTDNPFFQSLGTNGRSCASCHQSGDAWSVTPAHIRQRFNDSDGFDPIFRPNDGANCSSADVSTLANRRAAYSLLLSKGLIRVALPMPQHAEFTLVDFDDPYGCISQDELSMYRRPLPSTNLRFLSSVMWDGRETHPGQSMRGNLVLQARGATLGHAQALSSPGETALQEIVDFEMALATAQVHDHRAGRLTANGALGGPATLETAPFFIGINDPIGMNPTGAPFESRAFTIFDAWRTLGAQEGEHVDEARLAVARGQEIFNTRPIAIRGVGGLNDVLQQQTIQGTCTVCHDTPDVGNHSIAMPLNIGTSDASRRTPDLPLYTFRCDASGEIVKTSDPGRALISGRCADIGKVKGPILRGLAARAPYFHNGSAATLTDVVNFYDSRFDLKLTSAEKADLIAFLRSL